MTTMSRLATISPERPWIRKRQRLLRSQFIGTSGGEWVIGLGQAVLEEQVIGICFVDVGSYLLLPYAHMDLDTYLCRSNGLH